MQITNALVTLALLSVGINAAPAPLNINLGAYSPALVVGDGALTFSGGAEGGAGGGAGKGKGGGKTNEPGGGAAAPAARAAGDPGAPQRGIIAGRDEVKVEKRQLSGFDRALTFAETALTKGPNIQIGNGEGGAGVGIIVDNNPAAAGGAAGGGAGKGNGKGNGAGGAAGAAARAA